MTDLEFFFDPVCPWAWITSRWVDEVAKQRSYDVTWRFISLRMINEEIGYGPDSEPWREAHAAGSRVLRAAAYAREKAGNEAVAGVVRDEVGAAWEAFGVLHLVRSPGLNGFDGKAIPRSGPGEANFLIRHDAHHGRTSAIGSTFEQDCGFT